LDGEEGGRIGENYPKYVKKALISKKTLGRLTNWILTDTFE